jgi:hypothetical protein
MSQLKVVMKLIYILQIHFVFILIISANFLAEIFPCGLQDLLRNNMIIKHTFGFFTMIFFVVLSHKNKNRNIYDNIKNSLGLYLIIIIISRCEIHIFYIILIFLGITYIVNILKHDIMKEKTQIKGDKTKKQQDENNKNFVDGLFSKINQKLTQWNKEPIKWDLNES